MSQAGILDAITVIEEFTVYVRGSQESNLEEKSLTKLILDDYGYEVFSFKVDRSGDWAALKAKHGIE